MLANDDTKCAGICIFLLDRKVEYYVEEYPIDDNSESNISNETDIPNGASSRGLKCALLGISQWSEQWCAAESVNLLLKDKSVVLKLNADPEADESSKYVSDLALLNGYKLYCQWADNYICDTVM